MKRLTYGRWHERPRRAKGAADAKNEVSCCTSVTGQEWMEGRGVREYKIHSLGRLIISHHTCDVVLYASFVTPLSVSVPWSVLCNIWYH
jgi:hypothetical protein